jgi:hypothetical protein
MQVKEAVVEVIEGTPEIAETNPGGLELAKATRMNGESG